MGRGRNGVNQKTGGSLRTRSLNQYEFIETQEYDLSKRLLESSGVEIISNEEGMAKAEELLQDSIEWASLPSAEGESGYHEEFKCSEPLFELEELLEEKFHFVNGEGISRLVFDTENKIIKIPVARQSFQKFAISAFGTSADAFCAQYVEKYLSDNFKSENGIRVASADLFHTSEGIPILVMEKLKLFENPFDGPRINPKKQPELFGEGINQVSHNEEMNSFERMSQIGIDVNGNPAIFDAGDWWQLEKIEQPGQQTFADFSKEYRVDLNKICPPSIAAYQYCVQKMSIEADKEKARKDKLKQEKADSLL